VEGTRPPQHLLRFRVEDWPAAEPEPTWFNEQCEGRPWAVRCADVAWSYARLRWVRQNARTLDDVNALYDSRLGYEPPPHPDPRRSDESERRIILALNRRLGDPGRSD
jgi:hypothetical protein